MPSTKKILTIRILGKERKKKVRGLFFDLAHYRNMLIILIRKYRELYGEWILNQSVLYGLLSSRGYSGKYTQEFEKVIRNILADKELRELFEDIKTQKEKIKNSDFVQFVLRQVIGNFKSFFRAYKEFQRDSSKFRKMPRPPKPKKLKMLMNLTVESSQNSFKREGDFIVVRVRRGEYLKIKLPDNFPYRVSSIRLKFFGEDFYADVVYDQEIEEVEPKGEYRAGIDIGLDELLAVVSENPSLRSFIVSGREIKAYNQWFNKKRAKLRSQINLLRNKIKKGNHEKNKLELLKEQVDELELKDRVLLSHRKRWMDAQLHRIARKVTDILYETEHKVIYIGNGAIHSKHGINLGRKTNQAFSCMPFRRLVDLIKYKANELGMEVRDDVDESYTSRTSPFADIKEVRRLGQKKRKLKSDSKSEKGNKELEKEIKEVEDELKSASKGSRNGNIFKDKVHGKVFHADLVGALNILRVGAELPKLDFYEHKKVLYVKLCNPARLCLMDLFFKVTPESLLEIGGSNRGLSLGVVKAVSRHPRHPIGTS